MEASKTSKPQSNNTKTEALLFNSADIMELINKEEKLHPDLVKFLQETPDGGLILNHTLVQSIVVDVNKAAYLNQQYRTKLKMRELTVEKKDVMQFIFLHERPYRFEAFVKAIQLFKIINAEYWSALRAVWDDSENIWQHKDAWLTAWSAPYADKHLAMNKKERSRWHAFPTNIQVYRGLNSQLADDAGLSWTWKLDKAIFFSKRWNGIGRVLVGTVQKNNIHAVLLGRGEYEIVSNKVFIMKDEIYV